MGEADDRYYVRALNRVTAERDELRKRIDAVMALGQAVESPPAYKDGYNECRQRVRDLLASKKESRFRVLRSRCKWGVFDRTSTQCTVAEFSDELPDAERHARELCDKLNNETGGVR